MPVRPTEEFNQLMVGVAVAAITKIVVDEMEDVEEIISALTLGKSLESTVRRSGFIHRIDLRRINADTMRKQLTQMRKEFQASKRQRFDQSSYSRSYQTPSYGGASRQIQQQETYPYQLQYTHNIPLPLFPGTIPPPPPCKSANQTTRDGASQVSQITHQTSHGLVKGGRNAQALKSRNPSNQGRRIENVITKRRIGKYNIQIKEPLPNTVADNEVDTNTDTCCLGMNFILLA